MGGRSPISPRTTTGCGGASMGSRHKRRSAAAVLSTGALLALATALPASSTASGSASSGSASSGSASSFASSSSASSFELNWTKSQKAAAPCSGAATLTCHTWRGRVTMVDDGDTVRVDVAGDGTAADEKVRLTGIQAMEQYTYSKYPK